MHFLSNNYNRFDRIVIFVVVFNKTTNIRSQTVFKTNYIYIYEIFETMIEKYLNFN